MSRTYRRKRMSEKHNGSVFLTNNLFSNNQNYIPSLKEAPCRSKQQSQKGLNINNKILITTNNIDLFTKEL